MGPERMKNRAGRMGNLFREIKPLKLSEGIANQIKDLIAEGKLQPGDKLPPERHLAASLGVGRSSLREAINSLETLGFVEKKKRKGLFIRNVSAAILSNPLRTIIEEDTDKLFQLYEIRKDIELASAHLAARRRTPEDLERMKALLDTMALNAANNRISTADDIGFHLAIAQSTQNVIRVHILENIFELYVEFINFVIAAVTREKSEILLNLKLHRHVYAAIEAGDGDSARQAMKRIFTWIEGRWKKTTPGER